MLLFTLLIFHMSSFAKDTSDAHFEQDPHKMNLCYFQADSEYAFRPVRYIEETTGPLETNDGRKISKYALVLPIDREHGLHDITVLMVMSSKKIFLTIISPLCWH